jgi:hypothetical protein
MWEQLKERNHLGRPKRCSQDTIQMDNKAKSWNCFDWIQLAWNGNKLRGP